MNRLCALTDIIDGKARDYEAMLDGAKRIVFAVRRGDDVKVYLNWCPHMGRPLNYYPGRFLLVDETEIFCAFHYARVQLDNGFCIDGPCKGDSLGQVETKVENGEVLIGERILWPEDARPS